MSILGRFSASALLLFSAGLFSGVMQSQWSAAGRLMVGIVCIGCFGMTIANEVISAIRDSKREGSAGAGDTAGIK
ncbi:MAG: hypothetical protein IT405_02015 [Candidatus Yanofskybacteria bacterium]|nr:hypothetical protein [Candidatus Yanofskybacteria bacterium]